ncbi:MAG: DUF4350 domain-containing protein [Janthinobacterium lividum]
MTTLRWYLLGLLALFAGYVALEYYRPKPIDWSITLSNKDKIPYGTYALYDVLPTLLGTDSVTDVREPIYNQFFQEEEPEQEDLDENSTTTTTISVDSADIATTTTFDTDSTAEATTESATDTTTVAQEAEAADSVAQPATAATADSLEQSAVEEDEDGFQHARANYLFVNSSFSATALETQALERFVAEGNEAFIMADNFSVGSALKRHRPLLDSLGVEIKTITDETRGVTNRSDSLEVSFRAPALAGIAVRLPYDYQYSYLTIKPGSQGEVLATDKKGHAVLVRLDYGRGHFLLGTVPLAFANYFVLPPRSRRFALAALSYLPAGRPVWWDEYQKQGRVGEQSVLRLLMAHDGLRWAYYLLLGTVVLLVLVEARRRQRVIPIIKPLPNTTLLFTRTVASLYRQGSNHQRIASKQADLFIDYLRTRFQEPAVDLGAPVFRERLSQKSGLPQERVDEVARLVNFARVAPVVSDRELLILSRAIKDFKRESR